MRRLRRWSRAVATLLALGASACGTLAPFETLQPTDDRYAVCYNSLGATPQQVEQLAGAECTAPARPRLVRQGPDLEACPLLTPTRAIFACAKP